MEYVEAAHHELQTNYGPFGVKILISTGHELTTDELRIVREAEERITDFILAESVRRNPEAMARAEAERIELFGLFQNLIFADELPNGYCNQWCCRHRPWFLVTTAKGRITIGWRKRVIQINWDETVGPSAEQLFPNEDVTKLDRGIHAWGIDKAREYIERLLEDSQ